MHLGVADYRPHHEMTFPIQDSLKSTITGRRRKPRVRTAVYPSPTVNHRPPTILAGSPRPHQIPRQKRKPRPGTAKSHKKCLSLSDARRKHNCRMAARWTALNAKKDPKYR